MATNKMSGIEKKLMYDVYGKWLWVLRQFPSHAAVYLAGIVVPPHERHWLRIYFGNYAENNIVASRGTSKSFSHVSLAAPLDTILHRNADTVCASASGFRGSKLLFEDAKRLVLGELRSQNLPAPFLKHCAESPKIIRQEPDRWLIKWNSNSQMMAVPTNNPDSMRGIRARKALVDERNTFDGEVVQQVIRPTLNVSGDFLKVASNDTKNQMFQVSTIDYTFRDWYKEIENAQKTGQKEYEAMQAMESGDWALYDKLMAENDGELRTSSFSLTRFDYTDLIIKTEVDMEDGSSYEVKYPLPPGLVEDDLRKWDERDRCFYWYTYPVAKAELEEPLRNGTMDEDLWYAEQRNVFITASGNVYSDDLVRKASEAAIHESGTIEGFENEFYAPVLRTCGDPCILGVDYAREKDDFAIIVIRLGELASGKFDPHGNRKDAQGRPCYGKTAWNSVVWAESWPHTTAAQAADKIRDMMGRFNLLNRTEFMGYGAIGMDARGGGGAVRDELAQPKATTLANGMPDPSWREPVKIYDPTDDNFAHYSAFDDRTKYWSGLRLLTPTNAENWEWTRLTKAGMEQNNLYIGYWQSPSTWATEKGLVTRGGLKDSQSSEYMQWLVGYNAIKKFKKQLVSLQIEMTPSGLLRVKMPGKKGTDDAKKDLYSAFIYAWQTAREHLVDVTKQDVAPPNVQPVSVDIGNRSITGVGWGGLFNR